MSQEKTSVPGMENSYYANKKNNMYSRTTTPDMGSRGTMVPGMEEVAPNVGRHESSAKGGGSEWADELCAVLAGNIDFACNYIKTRFDGVEVTKPEGTYILFADCTKWCEAHGKTIDDVERACWDVGVAVQDGRQFHGPCHIRMNLALPLSRVQEAFDRLDKYVFNA